MHDFLYYCSDPHYVSLIRIEHPRCLHYHQGFWSSACANLRLELNPHLTEMSSKTVPLLHLTATEVAKIPQTRDDY